MIAQKVLPKAPRMTPAEYLEWDRQQEGRHEYVDGKIIAMAGVSRKHNLIAGNIHTSINVQIANRPCEAYMESLRVRVSVTRYRLPDVVATCLEPTFEDDVFDTLLNPQLLVEVRSKSTQITDMVAKLNEYKRIESLTDYLIATQDQMLILHYTRSSDGWNLRIYALPEEIIRIESLDISLTVADVYRKVVLPEPETEAGEDGTPSQPPPS